MPWHMQYRLPVGQPMTSKYCARHIAPVAPAKAIPLGARGRAAPLY
jgi:hypothetical protein